MGSARTSPTCDTRRRPVPRPSSASRAVFERAPIGMALVRGDGRFALANDALAEFLGRSARELFGCTVADVTHPDDMPATSEAMARMKSGDSREWNTEKRYVRPTGEVRWGALRALLLHERRRRGAAHAGARPRCHRPAAGGAAPLRAVRRLRIMAGGAPLDKALHGVVEAIVSNLQCTRRAVAGRRGGRAAARGRLSRRQRTAGHPAAARRPNRGPHHGRRDPRRERRHGARPARGRLRRARAPG